MHHYFDDVYGHVGVPSGLLAKLVDSQAVKRLRDVSQAGASSFVRAGRTNTRYEHSLGVMTLTRLLGGDENECAAGLLQDLSHTAFSHTIDYLFDDRAEEFHERIFHVVIEQSDIPMILGRYDLSWQKIFSEENLRRVDVPAPRLCADRVDYTLRDLIRLGHISALQARQFVRQLDFIGDQIVVKDVTAATTFVDWYSYLVGRVFMNPLELYVHDQFAKLIRKALRLNVIQESDLLTTDRLVLGKILSDDAHGLADDLARIRRTRHVCVGAPEGIRVYSKARKIDPPVLVDGAVVSLSAVAPNTSGVWAEIEKVAQQGIIVSMHREE
jgi:HD superfamily phosphohydrolase